MAIIRRYGKSCLPMGLFFISFSDRARMITKQILKKEPYGTVVHSLVNKLIILVLFLP